MDPYLPASEKEKRQEIREAKQAWKKLTPGSQTQVIHMVLRTRREELKNSFSGVLSIGKGYRRKKTESGFRVTKDLCVLFVVKKKWRKDESPGPRQHLIPKLIYSHVYDSRKRRYVTAAIPTDVMEQRDRKVKLRANDSSLTTVWSSDRLIEEGVLTAFLRHPETEAKFALGCHHVLLGSKQWALSKQTKKGLVFTDLDKKRWGKWSGYEGMSTDENRAINVDSALGAINNEKVARSCCALKKGKQYKPWTGEHLGDLKQYVVTKRDWIHVSWHDSVDETSISYCLRDTQRTRVIPCEYFIIKSGLLKGGDSGAPAVAVSNDNSKKLFLGMFIGTATNNTYAVIIPAAYLIRGKYYTQRWKNVILKLF